MQDAGACTFRYGSSGLPAGNYTVALTSDSGTTFKRTANVTVPGRGRVQNFTPARVRAGRSDAAAHSPEPGNWP